VRCNVGIVAAKLVLMPAFSTLLMLGERPRRRAALPRRASPHSPLAPTGLNLTIGRHGAGWFALRSPYDQAQRTRLG